MLKIGVNRIFIFKERSIVLQTVPYFFAYLAKFTVPNIGKLVNKGGNKMAIRFSDKMKFAKKHLGKSAKACSMKNRSRWNSLFELSSGNMENWSYSRSDAKSWKRKEALHRKIALGVLKI